MENTIDYSLCSLQATYVTTYVLTYRLALDGNLQFVEDSKISDVYYSAADKDTLLTARDTD